jgi:hypothetical protein
MRPTVSVKRAARAAAPALLAAIFVAAASGCASSPAFPGATGGTAAPLSTPSSVPGSAPATVLPACSLLRRADVLAVAATFRNVTITVDGHGQTNTPPTNDCGFNQKGVYTADGITNTLSGDHWATLTVVTGGASYAFGPNSGDTISGLGDGAYWDPGSHTVVIRTGQNVLQVVDEVPVNLNTNPDLVAAYRQAAQALAVKILSHL